MRITLTALSAIALCVGYAQPAAADECQNSYESAKASCSQRFNQGTTSGEQQYNNCVNAAAVQLMACENSVAGPGNPTTSPGGGGNTKVNSYLNGGGSTTYGSSSYNVLPRGGNPYYNNDGGFWKTHCTPSKMYPHPNCVMQ